MLPHDTSLSGVAPSPEQKGEEQQPTVWCEAYFPLGDFIGPWPRSNTDLPKVEYLVYYEGQGASGEQMKDLGRMQERSCAIVWHLHRASCLKCKRCGKLIFIAMKYSYSEYSKYCWYASKLKIRAGFC